MTTPADQARIILLRRTGWILEKQNWTNSKALPRLTGREKSPPAWLSRYREACRFLVFWPTYFRLNRAFLAEIGSPDSLRTLAENSRNAAVGAEDQPYQRHIFNALLPPLLLEAAFYLRWNQLRRDLPVILTLAIVGAALSGAVTAMGMHYSADWQWPSALVFGSLIAATDPVSVIATLREAKVHGRRLLIEAESLFNDGNGGDRIRRRFF